ncbi:MAG: tetratricopeptide repeat protein [Trueperaceae bacterium]|nr:tetratricopeptide repeat protein [Trueperaceae bacterium]
MSRTRAPWTPCATAPPARAALVAIVAAALLGLSSGQGDPASAMRDLLARGYYNAAAQLEGPNLVQQRPDDPEAHYLYARAAWLTDDLTTARRELDAALALVGSPPAPYVHLNGLLRAAEGDAEGALRSLENAFLRSRDYQHGMDYGLIAWREGRLETALSAYAAAAETTRGQREPWPHLNRGRILARVGRSDEAVEAFEMAIEVFERSDPGGVVPPSAAYVEAFYRLGRLREAAGDLARAEQDYKAARSIDPNYTPAIQALDALTRRLE